MNLSQNPTQAELRALFAAADDEAGHHILWVDTDGQVHLTLLDETTVLTEFTKAYPTTRLRFEAFCVGNSSVGPDAANDVEHINRYYNWLIEAWQSAAGARHGEIFVD